MGYGKKIASDSLCLFALMLIGTAIGYGTRLFLARNISAEQFGLFYSVLAFVGFFFAVKSLGYRSAIARYIPEWIVKKKEDAINSSVWFGIITQGMVGLVIFLPLFFGADFLAANFFKHEDAKIVIQLISIELLISVMFMREILQGFQKILHFGSVELAKNALVLIFIIPLIGLGAFGIAISYLFASVIVQFVFMFYIFKRLLKKFRPVFGFSKAEKDVTMFGLIAFVSTMASYISSYADTIILTGLKTLLDVGLYQAALPTSQLLWILATPIGVAMLPAFSQMWANNEKASMARGITLSLKLMMVLIIGPVLVIAAWPDIIISLLFGSKFLGASQALQILAFNAIFYSLMMINTTVLSAIGKPGAFTKTFISLAVANVILNILLIPPLGIIGAAIASVMSYILAFFITTFYVKKYINLSAPWSDIVKIIMVGFLTLLSIHVTKIYLSLNIYLEIAFGMIIFIVVYSLLLKIFKVFTKNDIKDIETMGLPIPNIIKRFLLL